MVLHLLHQGLGLIDGRQLLGRTLAVAQQRSLVAKLERSQLDLDPNREGGPEPGGWEHAMGAAFMKHRELHCTRGEIIDSVSDIESLEAWYAMQEAAHPGESEVQDRVKSRSK